MKFFSKILLFIILITSISFAQGVDRFITINGNTSILETGKFWSNTTRVNYIFKPPNSYSLVDLYVRNYNSSNPHTPIITVFETSDSSVSGYAGQSFKWSATALPLLDATSLCIVQNVATQRCSFQVTNAGLITVSFTSDGGAAGSNDFYDLILAFSSSNAPGITAISGFNSTSGAITPVQIQPSCQLPGCIDVGIDTNYYDLCNNSSPVGFTNPFAATITAGTTAKVITHLTSTIRICNINIGISTSGTFQIIEGTGATCGTGTTNLSPVMNLTAGNIMVLGTGANTTITTLVSTDDICITAVTGNVQVFGRVITP